MNAKDHFLFLYGEKFWYASPDLPALLERGDDLYKSPIAGQKCAIWHLAHIIHKEDVHIGEFIQRPRRQRSHTHLDGLLAAGHGIEKIREMIPDPTDLLDWHTDTRRKTLEFITGLPEDAFDQAPEGSLMGLTSANWLSITLVHNGIHMGRIDAILSQLRKAS